MTRADYTLGALALLSLPLQQAGALSHVNSVISADTSHRQLEGIPSVDTPTMLDCLGPQMVFKLKDLPTSGETDIPWPGATWDSYLDGINHELSAGKMSPAAKYAKAFGLDVKTFMDAVSKDYGIDNSTVKCKTDVDCASKDGLARVCVARQGSNDRRCVVKSAGIQDGWAVASIIEYEPKCAVTYNGITFQPTEIKALAAEVYQYLIQITPKCQYGTRATFASTASTSFDIYGRNMDISFLDVNPGELHLVAANMLGITQVGFIVDSDTGVEDSMHPVYRFNVYDQKAYSLTQAAKTFYGLDFYNWNIDAASIVYVKSGLTWINATYTDGDLLGSGQYKKFMQETIYTYLLELSKDGNIIGGEWIGASNKIHPDIMWIPKTALRQTRLDFTTSFGLTYPHVRKLVDNATTC